MANENRFCRGIEFDAWYGPCKGDEPEPSNISDLVSILELNGYVVDLNDVYMAVGSPNVGIVYIYNRNNGTLIQVIDKFSNNGEDRPPDPPSSLLGTEFGSFVNVINITPFPGILPNVVVAGAPKYVYDLSRIIPLITTLNDNTIDTRQGYPERTQGVVNTDDTFGKSGSCIAINGVRGFISIYSHNRSTIFISQFGDHLLLKTLQLLLTNMVLK